MGHFPGNGNSNLIFLGKIRHDGHHWKALVTLIPNLPFIFNLKHFWVRNCKKTEILGFLGLWIAI